MKKCDEKGVKWAIISDKYGVWFSNEVHEWYDKNPNSVTEKEFLVLKRNLEDRLIDFDEILFYHNPGRFHPVYRKLLNSLKFKDRVIYFSHINEIY